MTEAEWLATTDPGQMLWTLKASDRKLRLFAVACCRRIWDVLPEDARQAVEVAERFTDGETTAEEFELAADTVGTRHDELEEALGQAEVPSPEDVRLFNALEVACVATRDNYPFGIGRICGNVDWARGKDEAEYPAVCGLARDIFGNPFRPVAADPAWLTPTVVSLARQVYDARDFSALPILADALQDAGCDSDDILNHCRDTRQVHVRGCWVVDLVLGKE